jgi:hypothetical protein
MANFDPVFGNDSLLWVGLTTLSSSLEEEEEFDLSKLLNDAGRIVDDLKYDWLLNDECFPQELIAPTPIVPQGILSTALPQSTMDIENLIYYSLSNDNGVASNSVSPIPLNSSSSTVTTMAKKVNDAFLPSCVVMKTISYSWTHLPKLEPVKSIAESADSCCIPPLKKSHISLTQSLWIAVPEDMTSASSSPHKTSSKHKKSKKNIQTQVRSHWLHYCITSDLLLFFAFCSIRDF